MAHVLINLYRPKISTGEVETNLNDIQTHFQAVVFEIVAVLILPKLALFFNITTATTINTTAWKWV